MGDIVIVFDFDKTIIEVDSDNWVVDELGATDLFNHLLPTMPWNLLMDRMMKEVHAQGKSIEDIKDVLKRVSIHPRIVPLIKKAHSLGCDLRILSDANLFYIDTIMEHLGIKHCFSEINTNPSYVDEKGCLRISPCVDFQTCPHGCPRCPPNMCKGMIIERMQVSIAKEGGNKKMIYLGDGIGDFCPSLKLKGTDFVLPRKGFPVWELICKNRAILRAEVHEWADGADMEKILVQLIKKMKIQENNGFNQVQMPPPVDCKFESVPMAAYEALLPSPLRVHQ